MNSIMIHTTAQSNLHKKLLYDISSIHNPLLTCTHYWHIWPCSGIMSQNHVKFSNNNHRTCIIGLHTTTNGSVQGKLQLSTWIQDQWSSLGLHAWQTSSLFMGRLIPPHEMAATYCLIMVTCSCQEMEGGHCNTSSLQDSVICMYAATYRSSVYLHTCVG